MEISNKLDILIGNYVMLILKDDTRKWSGVLHKKDVGYYLNPCFLDNRSTGELHFRKSHVRRINAISAISYNKNYKLESVK